MLVSTLKPLEPMNASTKTPSTWIEENARRKALSLVVVTLLPHLDRKESCSLSLSVFSFSLFLNHEALTGGNIHDATAAMPEILSLVSSIVQVSSFGITLSATLHDYIETVVEAKERLQRLENEIKFTSNIISQLGAQFKDTNVQTVVSDEAIRLAQEGVAECEAIFQAMEDVIAKIRRSGNVARWTLYFRSSRSNSWCPTWSG
jgi:ribosome-associated translation inhibitor RaiA